MQRGVSSDTLCAELVAKEIQHPTPEFEKTFDFLVFLLGFIDWELSGAKHSPLASGVSCPEGGNRGGHRDFWQGHSFPHFSL